MVIITFQSYDGTTLLYQKNLLVKNIGALSNLSGRSTLSLFLSEVVIAARANVAESTAATQLADYSLIEAAG